MNKEPEHSHEASSQSALCLGCQKEPSYHFHVLQVRTLPIRDLGGERKVQALGDFQDFWICEDCARKKLERIHSLSSYLPRCLLFALIALLGGLLSFFFYQKDQVFFLFGLMAILAALLGIIGTAGHARSAVAAYEGKSEKDQLAQAAWDLLVDLAPKKNGEEDLTYIPVDSHTLSLKNGDLMVLYHLLPDIAIEAYQLIHAPKDQKKTGKETS